MNRVGVIVLCCGVGLLVLALTVSVVTLSLMGAQLIAFGPPPPWLFFPIGIGFLLTVIGIVLLLVHEFWTS